MTEMNWTTREMKEADINTAVPIYIDYYNKEEEACWNEGTTYKRIHQVWGREDAMCLMLEENGTAIGFIMGYFEQYDDVAAYDLIEIVIAKEYQNQGIGQQALLLLEEKVKEKGGAMIQLQAVNDEMHEHFYGKLQYQTCNNLVLKSKWLD